MTAAPLDLSDLALREGLVTCLAVPRWVDDVVAGAPYATLADLLDAAGVAATPLSAAEVDQALASHPRIGERSTGDHATSAFSTAEQASSASDDAELAERLAAGNRAYEEKFGRIFLIRAAGRSRPEILDELHHRLQLEPDAEIKIVAAELRDITLRRIAKLFGGEAEPR